MRFLDRQTNRISSSWGLESSESVNHEMGWTNDFEFRFPQAKTTWLMERSSPYQTMSRSWTLLYPFSMASIHVVNVNTLEFRASSLPDGFFDRLLRKGKP